MFWQQQRHLVPSSKVDELRKTKNILFARKPQDDPSGRNLKLFSETAPKPPSHQLIMLY
jgi:hypothetical protein